MHVYVLIYLNVCFVNGVDMAYWLRLCHGYMVKWILVLKNQQSQTIWKWPKPNPGPTISCSHQIWTKTNYTMLFFVYCLLLSFICLSFSVFLARSSRSPCIFRLSMCVFSSLILRFWMSCQNQ